MTMICENCGTELLTLNDQRLHICPVSSVEPPPPLTQEDFDRVFKELLDEEE